MMTLSKPRRNRMPKAAPADEDIASIWSEVRAKPLRRRNDTPVHRPPAPVEPIIRWTLTFHDDSPRPSMFVVPGDTAFDRMQFYRKYTAPEWVSFRPDTIEDVVGSGSQEWVDEGLLKNFTRRLAATPIPTEVRKSFPEWLPTSPWQLLWAAVCSPDFIVEEPLRRTVDQPLYLLHDFYKALWGLRFSLKENESLEPAARIHFAIVQWMTGGNLSESDISTLTDIGVTRRVTTDTERYNVLFCLLSIAAQNGVFNRAVMGFDGLEHILRHKNRDAAQDMDTFLSALDRWVGVFHLPVGVLIGFSATDRDMGQLKKLHPKLAGRIEAGLAWTKSA